MARPARCEERGKGSATAMPPKRTEHVANQWASVGMEASGPTPDFGNGLRNCGRGNEELLSICDKSIYMVLALHGMMMRSDMTAVADMPPPRPVNLPAASWTLRTGEVAAARPVTSIWSTLFQVVLLCGDLLAGGAVSRRAVWAEKSGSRLLQSGSGHALAQAAERAILG